MASPTIISLPVETLSSIFGNFCLHCCHGDTEGPFSYIRTSESWQQLAHERSWYLADYRQPLVSLCLVSRRFRDVAQQILHHEFVLGYGDSWRSTSSSWDRRLTSFLRTVGRRADLAAVVRRVSLHPRLLEATDLNDAGALVELRSMGRGLGLGLPDKDKPPRYQGRVGRVTRPPAVPEAVDVPIPSEIPDRMLGVKTRLYNVDSYTSTKSFREKHALGLELLVILINRLPDVERLSIQQTVTDYDTPYLSKLRSLDVAKRPRLLKTLDLATHDHLPELMIRMPSQAAGVFELARHALQTLNLHMCRGFWTKTEHAPTFTSLKTLRLTHSLLTGAELKVLLSCCPAGLISFTYEAAKSHWAFHGFDQFQPSEATEYLRAHRSTLKALHLDLRHVSSYLWAQLAVPASLADFTALEDLFLSVNTFWAEDSSPPPDDAEGARLLLQERLPASTTSLAFAGFSWDHKRLQPLSRGLLGLAQGVAQEGKLAGLRQVRCDVEFEESLGRGLGPAIAGTFQGAGVSFGFGSWPPSQATVTREDVPSPLRCDLLDEHSHDWDE